MLGEEGYGEFLTETSGTIWIIEPIDGTMNFVNQKQDFAISIGIYHQGIGEIGYIYDVMSNTLYSALRGNGAFKNNTKLPTLKNETLSVDESIVAFSHRW